MENLNSSSSLLLISESVITGFSSTYATTRSTCSSVLFWFSVTATFSWQNFAPTEPSIGSLNEYAVNSTGHSPLISSIFSSIDGVTVRSFKGPIHDSDFNRNRDVQPDRGCDCCWWSAHTRSDRSVQSFSVESQFSTMSDLDSDDLANIALFLEAQLTRSGRFCPYTTATSTATLSSAHQISENSDQQQPQQRSASHGGGCGCRSPYTGKFGRGCRWRSRLRLKIAVVDGALYTVTTSTTASFNTTFLFSANSFFSFTWIAIGFHGFWFQKYRIVKLDSVTNISWVFFFFFLKEKIYWQKISKW